MIAIDAPATLLYSPKTRPRAAEFTINNIKENFAMIPTRSRHVYLATVIALLFSPASVPVLADEPTVLVQQQAESGLSMIIKNILGDTNYNFERFRGADDCGTETVYTSSRDLLGNYADAPEQHQESLRNYIMADKAQCNCVRAIIGKNFDILVNAVGSDLAQVPCP